MKLSKITLNKAKSSLIIPQKDKMKNRNKVTLIKSLSNQNVNFPNNLKLNIKEYSKKPFNYNLKNVNLDNLNHIFFNFPKKRRRVRFPRIRSYEELKSKIDSKLETDKNMSFFITDKYGIRVNKNDGKIINYRKKSAVKKVSRLKEYLNYNVFNEKDIEIKDLVAKFDNQEKQKKINRLQKRKVILNKLYGITPQYLEVIKFAKNQKHLSLEDYQDTIMTAFSSNGMYSSESLSDLNHRFKNIRTEIESVTPFPQINIKNIVKHFKSNKKRKNDNMLRLKDFLTKTKVPQDEFEEDEQKIISLKFKKNNRFITRKENDRLYMLPEHIRNLFVK
jgi:hypothetical protein